MAQLSQRLVRLLLLASATWLLSPASPAFAQVPVFPTATPDASTPAPASVPAEPGPPAEPGAPAELVPAAPAAPLPPAPPGPPGPPGLAPAPSPGTSPAPAKAALITEPGARKAAEARRDQDADDEGDEAADLAARPRWYGWQTLTADGVSLAALLVSASLDSQGSGNGSAGVGLTWLGLAGYEAAPGIIHFAHKNPGRGFASLGLRLGMPLAGAYAGASVASGCNTNLCEANGAAIGILLGMAGAIAIDAAVFAFDDPKTKALRSLGVQPFFSVTRRQAWVGLRGQL